MATSKSTSSLTPGDWRSVIEALIGHRKVDGPMGRYWLKGTAGDAMNAIVCAAGQNLRLLLRAIAAFFDSMHRRCWRGFDRSAGPHGSVAWPSS